MTDLPLHLVSETTKTVTLGWTPPPGVQWYTFYTNDTRVSNAAPVDKNGVVKESVRFGKSYPEPYYVVALVRQESVFSVAVGVYSTAAPPPPPTSSWPAPPVNPTVITDAPNLGVNVTTRQDLRDIVIDGTGETAVLFQGSVNGLGADGSTIRRVKMSRVAASNSVGYGKHGIYGKALNLVGEDVEMNLSQNCADGLSVRFPSTWRRFKIDGQHAHAITFFETGSAGDVLFEDFVCTFNNSGGGIWMDREPNYQTKVHSRLVFRRVHMTGPSNWFVACEPGVFAGSVTIEGCTLNGVPVTAANCRNVGSPTIVAPFPPPPPPPDV